MGSNLDRQFDALDGVDLRLLVELDRYGSITQAAKSCGFGQPAASKRLQRMAKAFGFQLVVTDGAATRLTAEGQKVASHGKRVLGSLDKLKSDLDL